MTSVGARLLLFCFLCPAALEITLDCFSLGALDPGMLMGTVAFGERNC